MTGPEHFRRAEQLLGGRNGHYASMGVRDADQAIALAQVHATLALTAATVMPTADWRSILRGDDA